MSVADVCAVSVRVLAVDGIGMSLLRAHAFAHDLPVTQVARQVVAWSLRFGPGTAVDSEAFPSPSHWRA